MMGDETLGTKLTQAVENDNSIVSLTPGDRTRLIEVLTPPPAGLGGLRETLIKQRDRSNANDQRMERNRRELERGKLRLARRSRDISDPS